MALENVVFRRVNMKHHVPSAGDVNMGGGGHPPPPPLLCLLSQIRESTEILRERSLLREPAERAYCESLLREPTERAY